MRPTPYSKYSPINLRASELDHIFKYGLPPFTSFLQFKPFQKDPSIYSKIELILKSSPHLTRLKILQPNLFLPNHFQFPSRLQELTLSLNSNSQPILDNLISLHLTTLKLSGLNLSINLLPSTLKYLKLTGCFKISEECLTHLPLLSHLIIKEMKPGSGPARAAIPSDSLITFLPPSLSHLQLPHNALSPCNPPSLPPNLISLIITNGHNWPHRINTRQADLTRHYPSSLKLLELHLPSLPRLHNIPPSLTHLHLHVGDFNQEMNNLPLSLKSLIIDTNPGQFSNPSFKHPLDKLPSTLVSFTFLTFSFLFVLLLINFLIWQSIPSS